MPISLDASKLRPIIWTAIGAIVRRRIGWATNEIDINLALLTLLALLYAGWLVFTGSHRRLRYGWVLLVGCFAMLAIELGILVARGHDQHLVLGAVLLGGIYLLLVARLRREYWKQQRQLAQQVLPDRHYKHPVLIINPKSGNGRAIKAGVDDQARDQGIEVIITEQGDSITGLAQRAVAQGADVLGVSGGDGTLGAVAKVALDHSLPLVVLPGGTRCHFARDIGLEPNRISDALAGFWGVERQVTVGLINGRLFLNNASFGIYADIVDHPQYREHKLATSRKVLREVLGGQRSGFDLAFTDQTGAMHEQAVQILVGVNYYQTLNLLELGRREALDTDVLQVIAVTGLDDATIRSLMGTLTFKKSAGLTLSPNLLLWTTKKFTVLSGGEEVVVGVDGEREVYELPVRLSVAPQKLRLLVPAEGVRSRPKAATNPEILKQLWRAVLGK